MYALCAFGAVNTQCFVWTFFYNNNNNNMLYSSQREIKDDVGSHNEEHISIILRHETHAHTHS